MNNLDKENEFKNFRSYIYLSDFSFIYLFHLNKL